MKTNADDKSAYFSDNTEKSHIFAVQLLNKE